MRAVLGKPRLNVYTGSCRASAACAGRITRRWLDIELCCQLAAAAGMAAYVSTAMDFQSAGEHPRFHASEPIRFSDRCADRAQRPLAEELRSRCRSRQVGRCRTHIREAELLAATRVRAAGPRSRRSSSAATARKRATKRRNYWRGTAELPGLRSQRSRCGRTEACHGRAEAEDRLAVHAEERCSVAWRDEFPRKIVQHSCSKFSVIGRAT